MVGGGFGLFFSIKGRLLSDSTSNFHVNIEEMWDYALISLGASRRLDENKYSLKLVYWNFFFNQRKDYCQTQPAISILKSKRCGTMLWFLPMYRDVFLWKETMYSLKLVVLDFFKQRKGYCQTNSNSNFHVKEIWCHALISLEASRRLDKRKKIQPQTFLWLHVNDLW